MGMDVYGKNPKQNRTVDEFPVMKKFDAMEFQDKWKILDKDEKTRDKYWKQKTDYEDANKGYYFRNNCWWWRPLWNYCYEIAPDLIDMELHDNGHHNSGAGLDAYNAERLGQRLMELIADGSVIKYEAEYMQHLDDLPDEACMRCNDNNRGNNKKKDCTNCNQTGLRPNFNKSYPFDSRNVEEFAHFCLQSGGFEIC